ncbi:hypothetical protein ABZZ80_01170 [Streptomyces sp. NPDC006356]
MVISGALPDRTPASPPVSPASHSTCSIKKIKRQLYGRAGFELRRKMILLQ